ncbi:MAG: hypothetical protein IH910_06735 [Proteobacteria bacterium]|nr:hypothetical protein [Pseudomonadota bacterium]
MTDVIPIEGKRKRDHRDIHEDLDTNLRDINAFLDIMTTCQGDECDVVGAAFAMQRMVEEAQTFSRELYASGGAS